MKRSWIYILRCVDNSLYVGCTTNLEKRIRQHNDGIYHNYTSSRRPLQLLYIEEFSDVRDAILRERQIKAWSRSKKEALIRGDAAALNVLARSHQARPKRISLDSSAATAFEAVEA
ncbi:MAG: GIY-YIG nuclease family protein [Ignavibacteriales bacterium]|nr:GIY-YIG nuclease family protein [Ignavibacteriales bacterium]